MSAAHDLDGLIRFILRDEVWSERLREVLDEHLGPALEEFDIDFEDLGDLIGQSWPMILWGCAFEDLLGRRYGAGGDNVADLYLKRRGWKEPALTRSYIEGLRDAPVSLYEVSEIRPGQSMQLRDVLTGSGPVTVQEKSATRSLKPWDRVVVRVVPQRKGHVISGALLPFSPEAVEFLMDGLRHALKIGKRKELRLTVDQLRKCAPIFAGAWLFSCLPDILDPTPIHLSNSEGDDLLFHDVRFPLAKGVTQAQVATRLDKVAGLERTGPKEWTWLEAAPAPAWNARGGLALESTVSAGRVLGTLELKGKALTLSVNSARRAERGVALIREALGDLVKPPLTAIRTIDQVRADDAGSTAREEHEEIPPEIARQAVHELLDRHYRGILDEPVPALGGKTPREAARTPAGRKKVVDWLKLIENRSASNPGSPLAEYDFRWMWEELGLEDQRR
ncbi:hypothetical protein ACRDNQ_01845 [Palleronia sp. KMU-117]|uniref:hypothetical protein n=1 Tax=Palleronia sp. KMU-117 TaxID=3434108 RepID=UPI003D74EDA3